MRETNDVKYEFKFDHVLILASSLAAPDLSTNFQTSLPARKKKKSIDKTKSRIETRSGTEYFDEFPRAECVSCLFSTDICCGMS